MTTYVQFAAALLFVLALIVVAALLARRFGFGLALRGTGVHRRRLGLVEVLPLDGRRKLVLLRCDETEHLVILGPAGETVVGACLAQAEKHFRAVLGQQQTAEGVQ